MIKIKVFLIILLELFVVQHQGTVFADSEKDLTDNGWSVTRSRYFNIFFHPGVDIKRVNKRLRIEFYDILLDRREDDLNDKGPEGVLAGKLDLILQKVEKILDMYPRKIHLNMRIYEDQSRMNDVYNKIDPDVDTGHKRAFYVHKRTTIYISQKAVLQGVIAHEMAHAIIDHYFLMPPPDVVGELLAQYAEVHLED